MAQVTDSRLCIGEETDRAPGNSAHGGWHDQADQLGKSAEAEAAGTAPFPAYCHARRGAVDGAYDHAGKSSTRNAGDFNVIEFFHFIYLL
ncbi:hypothetical protein P38_0808 [Pseudomonas aeruginosa MH38]|nr:hypothetical protein P38_0808 [Pseudomonas aeruginosa MH38]CEI01595.1 hypothetical protein PAMH19_0849 [Pseudomonas aeruginosa]